LAPALTGHLRGRDSDVARRWSRTVLPEPGGRSDVGCSRYKRPIQCGSSPSLDARGHATAVLVVRDVIWPRTRRATFLRVHGESRCRAAAYASRTLAARAAAGAAI